jgi:hypothetical protein
VRPLPPSKTLQRAIAVGLPWVVGLLLAIRLVLYAHRHSVDVLFRDQWDFADGLFHGAGPWELFRLQNGPHRQGLGGWVLALVFHLSGWNVRAEVLVSAMTVVAATVLALLLVRRLTAAPSWLDVAIPLLCLSTSLGEIFVGTSNPAHGPLPMLLVFLLAWCWALPVGGGRTLVISLLGFLATYTGFGFFAGVMNPLLFVAELVHARGERRRTTLALIGLLLSILALGSFFVGWYFFPAVGCFRFPHPRPLEYAGYVGRIVLHPLGLDKLPLVGGAVTSLVAMGTVGLAGWLAVAVLRRDSGLVRAVGFLLGFTVLFVLNTAVGRVCLGLDSAGASRYVPYVVPGWIALFLLLRSGSTSRVRTLALVFLVALAAIRDVRNGSDLAMARYYASGKRRWAACYLTVHDVVRCDQEADFPIHFAEGEKLLRWKLDFLEARGLSLFRPR